MLKLRQERAGPTAVATASVTDPLADCLVPQPDGALLLMASSPDGSFGQNFPRDAFLTGIIGDRLDILATQLKFSAQHQWASDDDPTNGAMRGRIHHQKPGVVLRNGVATDYAACDTTPLFLVTAERLAVEPGYARLVEEYRPNIEAALEHVASCIGPDELYWERSPRGGSGHGLYVTQWADSILPHVDGELCKLEPVYPVTYPLVHFIAARGLLAVSRLTEDSELAEQFARRADTMFRRGIAEFIRPDGYVTYRDSAEELVQASADELQALAFIPEAYTYLLPIDAIRQRAETLVTPIGFVCTPPEIAELLTDGYHGDTVWTHAQTIIHHGTGKHGLFDLQTIAGRMAGHELDGQELFDIMRGPDGQVLSWYPRGNQRQAWAIAAKELYFKGLVDLSWL